MLKFPKGYFDAEEIDGFQIECEMKNAWAAQFEIYKIIESICIKNNIKVFAMFGTLLGAIRHNGFIPWDDDFDIGMIREDYERFVQIAKDQLPDGFEFINVNLNQEWDNSVSRVTNGNRISISDERIIPFHGCAYGMGIDIFPIDHLPNDPNKREWVLKILNLIISLYGCAWVDYSDRTENAVFDEGIQILEDVFNFKFYKEGNIKNQLFSLFDTVCASYGDANDDLLCIYPLYLKSNGKKVYHKKWFEDVIRMNYETDTVLVPIGYDPVLYISNGENFMKYIIGGSAHEYPSYNKQREAMKVLGLYECAMELREKANEYSCDCNVPLRVKDNLLEVPNSWKMLVRAYKSNCNCKVLLLAFNSAALLKHGDMFLKKMEMTIKSLNDNNIVYIYTEDDMFEKTLENQFPELKEKYELVKKHISDRNGIISDSIHYDFCDICDAYYGNGTTAMGEFIKNKKPIMIMNVEV